MRYVRTGIFVSLAVAAAIAAAAACKEQTVDTVTLELGVDNNGTVGFACTEDLSATCSSILSCVLRTGGKATATCLSDVCLDGGINRQCASVEECLRKDAGTAGECYSATCTAQRPLVERASDDAGGADVHLIVDFIGLGGTPGCRVSELRGWCTAHPCRPIRRTCVPIHLGASAFASQKTLMKSVADAFAAHRTLDPDAPSEPVIVRIAGVAKAGACTPDESTPTSALAAPPVGCAYSCPTVLTAAEGAINVDFDTFGQVCTEANLTDCFTVFADAGVSR